MEPNFEPRDNLIDSYLHDLEGQISFVFGQFLAGLSDDPRAAVFDILLLDLLSSVRPLLSTMPWRRRAEVIVDTLPDAVPPGSTTGLEAAQEQLLRSMESYVAGLASALATKAGEMGAAGQSNGFQDAASEILDNKASALRDSISNALLMWERIVLDKVADLMAEQPVWAYAGPLDRKNREFCRAVLLDGRVYTRQEIEQLNGHPLLHSYVPPNVFTYCGGINCRHVWLPVSKASAREMGLT